MSDRKIKTEILIHDLKVPISVIDAGAKSLLNRQDSYGPLTERQVKVVKRIIRNALVTQRLVNDTLELGRSREGVMIKKEFRVATLVGTVLTEIFDLADPSVTEMIREARSYQGIEKVVNDHGVRLDFDSETWQKNVYLDEAKVRQILRNLVTNAFKHKKEFVTIRGRLVDKQLLLMVKDDGRGIAPADHQKIFETYFTTGSSIETAIRSHGLGLAGVMVLLKDMGGTLKLDSDYGKGAEFVVNIPL